MKWGGEGRIKTRASVKCCWWDFDWNLVWRKEEPKNGRFCEMPKPIFASNWLKGINSKLSSPNARDVEISQKLNRFKWFSLSIQNFAFLLIKFSGNFTFTFICHKKSIKLEPFSACSLKILDPFAVDWPILLYVYFLASKMYFLWRLWCFPQDSMTPITTTPTYACYFPFFEFFTFTHLANLQTYSLCDGKKIFKDIKTK